MDLDIQGCRGNRPILDVFFANTNLFLFEMRARLLRAGMWLVHIHTYTFFGAEKSPTWVCLDIREMK
jgi:hypothetical protein